MTVRLFRRHKATTRTLIVVNLGATIILLLLRALEHTPW